MSEPMQTEKEDTWPKNGALQASDDKSMMKAGDTIVLHVKYSAVLYHTLKTKPDSIDI